jgi:hypothetical protein
LVTAELMRHDVKAIAIPRQGDMLRAPEKAI